ncbi:MAG: hypothetical protein Q8M11_03455 [Sulfuritalea sp.]|nr:hypothetical protein [Sulfuritalea sp.]
MTAPAELRGDGGGREERQANDTEFRLTDNPRELRALHAALRRSLPREHLDREAGCSNGPDQIAAFDLPTKPRKVSDKRSLQVDYSVEAESMPASILRGILRDEVEALLPPHALEVAKVAEQSEREHLAFMAATYRPMQEGDES